MTPILATELGCRQEGTPAPLPTGPQVEPPLAVPWPRLSRGLRRGWSLQERCCLLPPPQVRGPCPAGGRPSAPGPTGAAAQPRGSPVWPRQGPNCSQASSPSPWPGLSRVLKVSGALGTTPSLAGSRAWGLWGVCQEAGLPEPPLDPLAGLSLKRRSSGARRREEREAGPTPPPSPQPPGSPGLSGARPRRDCLACWPFRPSWRAGLCPGPGAPELTPGALQARSWLSGFTGERDQKARTPGLDELQGHPEDSGVGRPAGPAGGQAGQPVAPCGAGGGALRKG